MLRPPRLWKLYYVHISPARTKKSTHETVCSHQREKKRRRKRVDALKKSRDVLHTRPLWCWKRLVTKDGREKMAGKRMEFNLQSLIRSQLWWRGTKVVILSPPLCERTFPFFFRQPEKSTFARGKIKKETFPLSIGVHFHICVMLS